jgi:hypothetical protein
LIAYSPPSKQLSIDIRDSLSEKGLNRLERRCIRSGNKAKSFHQRWTKMSIQLLVKMAPIRKISMTITLQELMRRLEKLTIENKELRAKAKNKKVKGNSSSSEEEDCSFEEDVPKREKKSR